MFRNKKDGEHDRLIIDDAVQMASSDDVLEEDHRTGIEPPRLTVRQLDGNCSPYDDDNCRAGAACQPRSDRVRRGRDQQSRYGGPSCGTLPSHLPEISRTRFSAATL